MRPHMLQRDFDQLEEAAEVREASVSKLLEIWERRAIRYSEEVEPSLREAALSHLSDFIA